MPSCSPQVRPGAALSALTPHWSTSAGGCFHGICKKKSSIPLQTSFCEQWGRMATWVPRVAQAHGRGSGCLAGGSLHGAAGSEQSECLAPKGSKDI